MNPSSFTFEFLNGLKFKELQKLSKQYHVNKRWAKKQELIENLLNLKCSAQEEKEENKNESTVFSMSKPIGKDEKNVTKTSVELHEKNINRQLTFVIKDKKINSISQDHQNNGVKSFNNSITSESGKTFNASRATFTIPPKLQNFNKNDLAITKGKDEKSIKKEVFPNKNSFKQLSNKSEALQKNYNTKLSSTPYAKIINRSLKKEDATLSKSYNSTIIKSMSKNNSAVFNSLKSPCLVKNDFCGKSMLEQHKLLMTKPTKPSISKIPTKCVSNQIRNSKAIKENLAFCMSEKKDKFQLSSTFSPLTQKNSTNQSQQNLPSARKMPDFKKIHQKQFEKMDSVVDYLKKKEERSKMLLGPSDIKIHKALQTVNNKNVGSNSPRNDKVLPNKSIFTRALNKESVKNKLPSMNARAEAIRDKNRSLINGVRTNKRFELQMKLRNV